MEVAHQPLAHPAQLDLTALPVNPLALLVLLALITRRLEASLRLIARLAQLALTTRRPEAAHQPLASPALPELTARQANLPAQRALLDLTALLVNPLALLVLLALITRRLEASLRLIARLAQLALTTRRPEAAP